MLGERGFLSQWQAVSLHESLAPVVRSLELTGRDVILWIFQQFNRFKSDHGGQNCQSIVPFLRHPGHHILLKTRPSRLLSTICTLKTRHFLQVLLTSSPNTGSQQYQILAGLSDFRAFLQIVSLLTSLPWYNFVASYLLLPWWTVRKFYWVNYFMYCIILLFIVLPQQQLIKFMFTKSSRNTCALLKFSVLR